MLDSGAFWLLHDGVLAGEISIPHRDFMVALDVNVYWCSGDYGYYSKLPVDKGSDDESGEES